MPIDAIAADIERAVAGWADLPFPVRVREQLVGAGRADLHYLHPETGWISDYIRSRADVGPVVELFRLNYERPWLTAGAPWRLGG